MWNWKVAFVKKWQSFALATVLAFWSFSCFFSFLAFWVPCKVCCYFDVQAKRVVQILTMNTLSRVCMWLSCFQTLLKDIDVLIVMYIIFL